MWYNEYIGLPYLDKGRDRTGVDCWGLVRLVYSEQFNIELPNFAEQYDADDRVIQQDLIAQHKEGWIQTTEPKPGSVVLFRVLGSESHVGIYVGEDKFLHVREGQDAVIEHLYSTNWRNRLVGFYNYSEKSFASLVAAPHPLRTERIVLPVQPGTTIADLHKQMFENSEILQQVESRIAIILNGRVVAKEDYAATIVQQNDVLEYRAVAGKSAFRVFLALAIVYIAVQFGTPFGNFLNSAGSLGLTGAQATALGTVAISTIGNLLVGALFPIRPPGMPADPGSPAQQLLMNGGQNQVNKYSAIPIVLGKVRYTCPLGAQNYVFSDVENSYLNMLLVWGFGPLQVSDLHIGASSISQYENGKGIPVPVVTLNDSLTADSQVQIDQFNSIAGRDVKQVYKGTELTANQNVGLPGPWTEALLDQNDITKIDVSIHFPQGLRNLIVKGDNAGKTFPIACSFDIEYRQLDQSNNPITSWGDASLLRIPQLKTILKPARLETVTYGGYLGAPTVAYENYYQWHRLVVNSAGVLVVRTGALTEAPESEPSAALIAKQKQTTYAFGIPTSYVRLPDLSQGEIPLVDICMYGTTVYKSSTACRGSIIPGTTLLFSQYVYSTVADTTTLALSTAAETTTTTGGYGSLPVPVTTTTGNTVATISAGTIARSALYGGRTITLGTESSSNTSTKKIVTAISRNSNTVTVTCSTAHNFSANSIVTIAGVTTGTTTFNGNFTIATVPSTTTFTFVQTGANESGTVTSSTSAQFYNLLSQYVNRKDAFTHTHSFAVPAGRYEVRVRRVTTDETEPDATNRPQYVSVLQTVTGISNNKPVIDPPNTKITKTALSIKATDQLNGTIEGINALVQTICSDWDNASSRWVPRATNNPASLFLYVLTHPANAQRVKITELATTNITGTASGGTTTATATFSLQNTIPFDAGSTVIINNAVPSSFNGTYTVSSCAVDQVVLTSSTVTATGTVSTQGIITYSEVSSKVDVTALQNWHNFCVTNNFTFNAVITQQRSVLDILRDICAAGRGSPAMVDGKWTVIIDDVRSQVVQHFSPHNSWGFEAVKRLPRPPHALKVAFSNEQLGYQEDEVIVYNTDRNEFNSEIFEQIGLPGTTNKDQAVVHARWHLAQAKLRPEIFTLNTDLEYLVCNRGDRVKVTHDVPLWGLGSGRIKNRVSATVFDLDEEVAMETGKNYNIRIRSKTGGSNVFSVTNPGDGYYKQITISTGLTDKVISTISRSSNTVTVVTTTAHQLTTGNSVVVSGVVGGTTSFNGDFTATVVNTTTFTYIQTGANESGTVNASSLVGNTTNIDVGDLFLFGELNTESSDLLVLGVEPFGYQNAKITLVDYASDLYDVNYLSNNFTIPAYTPNITTRPKNLVKSITYKPVITKIVSDETVMEQISPGVFKYNIRISFDNPPGLPEAITYVEAQIDDASDLIDNWQTTIPVLANTKSITINDVQEGTQYRIRLRYVGNDGRFGPWQEYINSEVALTSWNSNILTITTKNKHSFDTNSTVQLYTSSDIQNNLLFWSEDFDTNWIRNVFVRVIPNAAEAPDGSFSADKLVESIGQPVSPAHYITSHTITNTAGYTTVTFSVHVKAVERSNFYLRVDGLTTNTGVATGGFRLDTGNTFTVAPTTTGTVTSVSRQITSIGNGWYRASLTVQFSAPPTSFFGRIILSSNTTGTNNYIGDGVSGLLLWGAQFEAGLAMTEYVPSALTFSSRSSIATYIDSTGTLQTASSNVARQQYNLSNLSAEPFLLREAAATNSIRNSTCINAAAGTPGTLPTNWVTYTPATGYAHQIVSTGTENGIPYIDFKVSGTPTVSGSFSLLFESLVTTGVANGQTWALSAYVKLVGGSLSNISLMRLQFDEKTAAGAYITSKSGSSFIPNADNLILQRRTCTGTLNGGSTVGGITPYLTIAATTLGVPVDVTLRIGLPQLENNNLNTGVASVTINTAGTGYTVGDALVVGGGTGTAATLTVATVSAGAITSVTLQSTMTGRGNYSVFPTNPVSVTGGTGNGANFILTPYTQLGFASSPIPTSTAAVARSSDTINSVYTATNFNGTYTVLSTPSTKSLTVSKATNPGTWDNSAATQYLRSYNQLKHTVVGKSNPPSDVVGFTVTPEYSTGNLILSWSANTEIDLAKYEVRTDTNWGSTTNRVFLGNALTCISTPAAVGVTKTFYIKAIDYSNNYSSSATTTSYTTARPNVITSGGTYSYADTSTTDSTVTFNWPEAPTGAFVVGSYELTLTRPSGPVTIQKITGLTWTTRANWTGTATLAIKSIDILGNLSATAYSIPVVKAAPNAPSSVSFTVNNSNVTAEWAAVAKAVNGLPIQGYEIRKNNGTWGTDDSNLVWRGSVTSAIIKNVVAGLNTWYINTFDTDKVYGTTGAAMQFTPSVPTAISSATNTFAGTSSTSSTITFNWAAPTVTATVSQASPATGQFPVKHYLVSLTKPGTYSTLSVSNVVVASTTWTTAADWVGTATLTVYTVDVLDNLSVAYTINNLVKVTPNAPSNATFTVTDSQLFVDWPDVATAVNGLPVKAYEIRKNNGTWGTNDSNLVWRGSVSNATIKTIVGGSTNTWYINSVDTDNKYGATGASIQFTSSKPTAISSATSTLASTSSTSSTITFNWTAPTVTATVSQASPATGQFPVKHYLVSLTKPGTYSGLSLSNVVVASTTWTTAADWVGTATLTVYTVDVLDNVSVIYTRDAIKVAPNAPSSATFTVSDSQLLVDWDDVPAAVNGLPVAAYEIRKNNGTWGTNDSNLVWRGSVSNAIIKNNLIVGGSANTWYINSIDTDSKYSTTGTPITYTAQRPGLVTNLGKTIAASTTAANITFSWTAPAITSFKIAKYIVKLTRPNLTFIETTVDSTSWTIPVDWNGSATLTVISVDLLGTESATAAPLNVLINKPNQPGTVTNKTSGKSMNLSWASLAQAVDGLPVAGYEIRDADANWGSIDANLIWKGSVTSFSLADISLGTKTYYLSAFDTIGNYSVTSRTFTVVVDAPGALTNGTSAYSSTSTGSTVRLAWDKPIINTNTQFALDYYLITITKPGTAGPIVSTAKSLTNEYVLNADWSGTTTVDVEAYDVLANVSPTLTFTLAKVAPNAPTTHTVAVGTANIVINWPDVVKTSLPIAGYELRTTTTGWGTGGHTWKGSTSNTSIIPAQGTTQQTWYLKSYDTGGQYSTTYYTINFTTTLSSAPSIETPKYTDTNSVGATITFNWSATKGTFDIAKYIVSFVKGSTTDSVELNSSSWTASADWDNSVTATVSIRAADTLGNLGPITNLNVIKSAPGVPGTTTISVNASKSGILLNWVASTAGSLPIAGYELRPTGATLGNIEKISGLATTVTALKEGSNTWNLYAYDTDGQYSSPTAVSYTINKPSTPTITSATFNTNLTSSTAIFKWTEPSTSTFGIKYYNVSFTTTNPAQTLSSIRSTTDWEVPANWLGNGTLSVTAVDNLGILSTAAVNSSIAKAVPNSVGAISKTIQGTNIVLDWPDTVTSTNGLPVTGYEIRASNPATTDSPTWGLTGFIWKGDASNYTVNLTDTLRDNPFGTNIGQVLTWYIKAFDTDRRYSTNATSISHTISAPINTAITALYFEDTNLTSANVNIKWNEVTPEFGLRNYELGGRLNLSASTTSGSSVVTVPLNYASNQYGTKGLSVGDVISDNAYIPANTTITAINSSTQFVISNPASSTQSNISTNITNYSYINGTTAILPADWLGNKTFIIKVVDELGNKSTGVQQSLTKLLPSAPTNFRAQVIDNTVLLYWNLPVTTNSLPIALTRLKKGTSWSTAELVGDKSGTFTTITELAGGTFTYWIAAVDTDDNESAPVSLGATVSAPPDYVFNALYKSTLGGLSAKYVSNASTTLVVETTQDITAGMVIHGNGYTTGQTVAAVVNNTTLLTSAAPTTTPTVGGVIRFGYPLPDYVSNSTTSLVVTSTAGIAPGMPIFGNGYTNQTVVSIASTSTIITSAAPTTTPTVGQPITFGFSNAIKEANTGSVVIPANTTETFEQHFTTEPRIPGFTGWATPQAQVNAGYPVYIQPGLASGYYEELFDYGTTLGSSQISVALSGVFVVGTAAVTVTISTSLDNITYTNYAGSTSVFATNFRYIKVKVSVDQVVIGDIYQINSLTVRLDAKQRTDSGTVTAAAGPSTGTIVNFSNTFVDVTSITLTAQGTTTALIPVYNFIDTYASGTYTLTSNTCTVTQTAHGYISGQNVKIAFTSGGAPSGIYTIQTHSTNSFTLNITSANTSGSTQTYPQSMCVFLYDNLGARQNGTVSWTVRGY